MNLRTSFFKNIHHRSSVNLGGVLFLAGALYLISCILIRGSIAPISISSMTSSLSHWARHWHVIVVGLLPVYVALMIFGTAIIGIYLGSTLHRVIEHFFDKQ